MIFDKITSKFQLKLKSREAAASILGEALKEIIKDGERKNSIVLGIPRGGVIIADIVAAKLSCEFDIIIPRRLGAPHNDEVTIGAIMEDGTTYRNDDLIKELEISQGYIEKEKADEIEEIRRRTSLYRNGRSERQIKDKTLILVDDGAATGATLIAAARWLRTQRLNPKHIVIGLPISPKNTLNLLKQEADYVVVITSPSPSSFRSVEQYYQNFEPVPDEAVIQLMKKNAN
jgi:putative phosphoribosyl transferase